MLSHCTIAAILDVKNENIVEKIVIHIEEYNTEWSLLFFQKYVN